MKRLTLLALCLCLVASFCLSVGESQAGDHKPTFIHYTILPQKLNDGSDSWPLVMEFKTEVIKLAGGFTELGPSRGGSLHPDSVHHEENISFLVAADKDVSAELKKIIQKLFNDEKVFILVWQGEMVR